MELTRWAPLGDERQGQQARRVQKPIAFLPFFKQSHGAGVVQYQQQHYRAASTPSSSLRLSPLQLLHVGRLWRVVWCDGRAIRGLTQPGEYGSKSI